MPKPLKRALVGFEVELFTINRQGYVVNSADVLIKKAKKDGHGFYIKKECASNMIEIATYPGLMVHDAMDHLLSELEYLLSIAEKENILLCPLATYPGRFSPSMRTEKPYKIKESIFGRNRFKIAGRCTGFHCHYTLPKGIFDSELRILKMLVKSRIKDSLVGSYNLLIAADPALTAFMQSSPFYQGAYLGKDSRVIMYRGGEALGNKSGLYANFEDFGALPSYMPTALDLIEIISSRFEDWKHLVRNLGLNIKLLSLYGSILDTTWNPVKVNPNGTLEQRGMDMNHPLYIASSGAVIRHILKRLQEQFYAVIPSDIGIKTLFKVEGDIVYIPPFSYVNNQLQRLSAYSGFDSSVVYDYCRRFLKFAESTLDKDHIPLITPFRRMIDAENTVSDEILNFAKKKGFRKGDLISNDVAADIAVEHSKRLFKEIIFTRRLIRDLD